MEMCHASPSSMRRVAAVFDAEARRRETSDQGDAAVLVEELKAFLAARRAVACDHSLLSDDDAEQIAAGLDALARRVVRWAPEYAAFVDCFDGHLTLFALAGWTDAVLREREGELVLTTVPSHAVALALDSCAEDGDVERVLARFDAKLTACRKLDGSETTDDGRRVGHQKSPGFLWTLLMAAAGGDESLHAPDLNLGHTSGFRDVGAHSGAVQPTTRWPLVVHGLSHVIGEDGRRLVAKLEAEIALGLAEDAAGVAPDIALRRLQLAAICAQKVADLPALAHARLVLRVGSVRDGLEERLACVADEAPVTDAGRGEAGGEERRDHLRLFDASDLLQENGRIAGEAPVADRVVQKTARDALAGAGVPPPKPDAPLGELLAWATEETPNFFLLLHIVQRTVVALAAEHLGGQPQNVTLCLADITHLCALAETFALVATNSAERVPVNGGKLCAMRTELSSRVALVYWLVFALAFGASCRHHGALNNFAPPLDPEKELSALVLPEREAQNALKLVTKFLVSARRGPQVLGGIDTREATYNFGLALAPSLSQVEVEAARAREEQDFVIGSHWGAVSLAKAELGQRKQQRNNCEWGYRAAYARWNGALPGSPERDLARRETAFLKKQLADLDAHLRAFPGDAPITVDLELPYDYDALRATLALGLCRPPLIGLLCDVAAKAKETTSTPDSLELISIPPVDVYFDKSCSLWFKGARRWWGPERKSLHQFRDRLDGVKVYGSGQVQLLAGEEWVDRHWGRQLRSFEEPIAHLPLAAPDGDSAGTRGNLAIAKSVVHLSAALPTKEAYQALWNVRSDALQQPRKVIELLLDKRLPLGTLEFIAVAKAALFQVGPIENLRFVWRGDWQKNEKDSVAVLRDALRASLGTLSSRPSDRDLLLFIATVSSYFGQWHANVRKLARQAGRQALRWADDIASDFKDRTQRGGFDDEAQQSLRAEEFMCLGTLILSHRFGSFDDCDAKVVAAASARMACGFNLASSDGCRGSEVLEMHRAVLEVLARRSVELNNVDAASAAAGAVVNESIPSTSWIHIRTVANGWQCFFDGGAVHACTLTGDVVLNGAVPGQLPLSILESHMYLRSFAGFSLTVVPGRAVSSHRTLQTDQGGGVRYLFFSGEQTKIEEKQVKKGGWHLLLTPLNLPDLPTQILLGTTAWQSVCGGGAVLRGKRFWDRDVQFVCSVEGDLCRVPPHARKADWRELTWEEPRELLMVGLSDGRRVLSRFEALNFVHSFQIEGTGKVEHVLVRYGLRFVEENSAVYSLDWPDWSLCMEDAALGTLHSLSQFFLLRKQNRRKVCVPDGDISSSEGKPIVVHVPSAAFYDEDRPWNVAPFLSFHEFNMHPRFNSLVATSRAGRLHLAALYTASELSIRVPDMMERQAGSKVALELLRQVDLVSLLSVGEARSLDVVLRLGWFSTSLWDFADRTRRRFQDLRDLYMAHDFDESDSRSQGHLPPDTRDAKSRAIARSVSEPAHLPGTVRAPRSLRIAVNGAHDLADEIEENLSAFLDLEESSASPDEQIVGETFLLASGLGRSLLEGMKLSYQAHRERSLLCVKAGAVHGVPTPFVFHVRAGALVASCAKALTKEFNTLAKLSETSSRSALSFASSVYVEPTWRDLLRAACGNPRQAWPEVSLVDEELAVEAAQAFARLCVLEDKLSEIGGAIERGDKNQLLRELTCVREWDIRSHPAWLAFEAEQQVRIWPEQYNVAKALLDGKKNALAQLNVGLGKSSVILPMLLLHFAGNHCRVHQPVRLHFLPTMLDETSATLARSVGQCAVGCTLFVLPYSRASSNFDGISRVRRFEKEMHRTQGAVLCTTPDWRLSHELAAEEHRPTSRSFINILDESDLLLAVRYELVWATGSSQPLPNYLVRVNAVQGLLMLVNKPPKGSSLEYLLSDSEVVVQNLHSGCVRLCHDASVAKIHKLQRLLGEALFSKEFRPSSMKHEPVEPCPTWIHDRRVSAPVLDGGKAFSLVLRGLLSGGILVECLKAQHRVSFGNPLGKFARSGRNLAVPFRASETPSLRADFSSPDAQLVYTHIAHYNDGLASRDLVRAIHELLNLGPMAQDSEFARWRDSIDPRSQCSIVSPRMFDVTSPTQLEDEIEPHFSRNRAVIDFWLLYVVLPGQTQQFSEQRSKSAWDLVRGDSRTIGFAGTNDNKLLLPLDICEYDVDESVKATDALQMERFRHTADVTKCESSELASLVKSAVSLGCRALIDCGGLLAGLSTEAVVSALFEHHNIITIFDVEQSRWMVFYRDGRILPRSSSPAPESETFAVFDMGRCRGADLHLRDDCRALLTLGPKVTKAELIQAAGRLRGLGTGQTLVIAAAPDVWHALGARDSSVTADDVIRFTLANTISSHRSGLPRWGKQGKSSARHRTEKCKFELSELYNQSESGEEVESDLCSQAIRNRFAQIDRRLERFSDGGHLLDADIDAECERELEHEKEEENEEERFVEVGCPRVESSILSNEGEVCSTEWLTMSYAVGKFLPRFKDLVWPANLWCSLNFFKAIAGELARCLDDWQRTVDMVLVMEDKRVVLISSREAEDLLATRNCKSRYAIGNWSAIRGCKPSVGAVPMARGSLPALLSTVLVPNSVMMAAISFFACEGKIPYAASSSDLAPLLQNVSDENLIFEWFKLRTNHKHFANSDAEDAVRLLLQRRMR